MTRTLTVSQAKTNLFEIVTGVCDREDEVVLTKQGHPAAILLNYHEYERLMETMELLSDQKAMDRIRKAREYIKRGGKLLTHEEVFGQS